MVHITLTGKIIEVKKISSGAAVSSVKVVVEDRCGSCSDIWFFSEDLSAFNEIKKPE